MLHEDLRTPIYNIYGFVRFADEIVEFATTSQPTWPAFDTTHRKTLEINAEFNVLSDPEKEIREIFLSL
jgi:carboxylesterase type B